MQIKTYRGHSYSALIKKIKDDLGADAVILSTDCVNTGGRKSYEVVAALEIKPGSEEDTKPDTRDPAAHDRSMVYDGDWRIEWENFKNSFFKIIKNSETGPSITKRQRQVLNYLEKQGVKPEIIMDLWSSMAENIHRPTLKVLGELVPTHAWPECMKRSKIHAFIGPSGAGKTSTLIRIALEERKKNPRWKICLVNTDTQHAGGRLYLKHYAALSGLNYTEVKTAADWQDLAAKKQGFDMILVDTPGFCEQNKSLEKEEIEMLNIHCHLVLSPVYGSSQIDHYLSFSCHKNVKSIMWTKVDEACNFGVMVNASWKTGIPVSYFSNGKGLKNCSAPARQDNLWTLVFKKKMSSGNGSWA